MGSLGICQYGAGGTGGYGGVAWRAAAGPSEPGPGVDPDVMRPVMTCSVSHAPATTVSEVMPLPTLAPLRGGSGSFPIGGRRREVDDEGMQQPSDPNPSGPQPFAPQPVVSPSGDPGEQIPPSFEPRPLDPQSFDAPPLDPAARPRELRRSRDRKLAGVCGGLAEYFGVDPVIVRLLFFGGMFMGAATLPVYIAAWIVMPDAALPAQPPVFTEQRFAA